MSTNNNRRVKRRRDRKRLSANFAFHDVYYEPKDNVLGNGASGIVKLFKRKSDGMPFAVKILDKSVDNQKRECFKELRILNKCRKQKNISSLHEYYEDDYNYYIVMEYISGGDLQTNMYTNSTIYSHDEYKNFIKEIATGLSFLHKNGLSHRDLKPANILCTASDSISGVKIADFGLSKECDGIKNRFNDGSLNSTDKISRPKHSRDSGYDQDTNYESIVGSPSYMSPQTVSRCIDYGPNESSPFSFEKIEASDVWSLGVIAYELISGRLPFEGRRCNANDCGWKENTYCETCTLNLYEDIMYNEPKFDDKIWNDVSYDLIDLIKCMLEKDENKRITSDEILYHGLFIESNFDDEHDMSNAVLTQSSDNVKGQDSFIYKQLCESMKHLGSKWKLGPRMCGHLEFQVYMPNKDFINNLSITKYFGG